MGINQWGTSQGRGFDGDPHDHDVVRKRYHGHGGQEKQHGSGEYVLRSNVGRFEIGRRVY